MPFKPVKHGIKVWAMSDCQCVCFEAWGVHWWKRCMHGAWRKTYIGASVNKTLTNHRWTLWAYKLFTSVALVLDLLMCGLYGCGTVHTNRKRFSGYNIIRIGGVDHNDQLRGSIWSVENCTSIYIFWFLFDIAVMYIVSSVHSWPRNTHIYLILIYRVAIAKSLIADYRSRKWCGRSSTPLSASIKHFPVRGAEKGHRCYYCYNYKHVRHETM